MLISLLASVSLADLTSASPFQLSVTFSAILCATLFVYYLTPQRPRNFPPGPPTVPILGSLPFLLGADPHIKFTCLARRFGDIFSVVLGDKLVIVLNGYDVIKTALLKQGPDFDGRPKSRRVSLVNPKFLGLSFPSYSKEWRIQRKFCMQALGSFGIDATRFESKISEEIDFLVASLQDNGGMPMEMSDIIFTSVNNIICFFLFGDRQDYKDKQFQEMIAASQLGVDTFMKDPYGEIIPLLAHLPSQRKIEEVMVRCVDKVHSFVLEQIRLHEETLDLHAPRDFLDLYLIKVAADAERADGEENSDAMFTKDSMLHVMRDFFFAGTETVATTLMWGILHMVNNPDVQEKVQAELDQVVGHGKLPNYSDRAKLPYTSATLLEVQRISSVVPLSLPHSTICDTKLLDYDIPKETQVVINLWSVHHDPERWSEPEVFKPTRFLDEDNRLVKKDDIIPFSLGRRQCLGEQLARMELFLYFATLMHRFQFQPPEGVSRLSEGSRFGISLRPEPFKVCAKRRNKDN